MKVYVSRCELVSYVVYIKLFEKVLADKHSMMKNIFQSILLILLFNSCGPDFEKEKIIGGWRLAEVISFDSNNSDVDKMMRNNFGSVLIADGFVQYFFPDKNYTEITGYFAEHGKWSFQGSDKVRFGNRLLQIKGFETKKGNEFMIAEVEMREEDLKLELKFVREAKMLANYQSDPFHPKNNLWRIKPKEKETDEEIKARLINYVEHFAGILKAASEREGNVVSFAHSLGIIQVSRGGIGVVKKKKINKDWINCFYDEEDAFKAQSMFKKYAGGNKYKDGTSGNWVKNNYQILRSLLRKMKK